jgi:hypothetical protein
MNQLVRQCLAPGKGYYIKALDAALARRKIKIKFSAHSLIQEMGAQ